MRRRDPARMVPLAVGALLAAFSPLVADAAAPVDPTAVDPKLLDDMAKDVQRFTEMLEPWDEHDVTEAARLLTLLEQTLASATVDLPSAAQILAPTSEKVPS